MNRTRKAIRAVIPEIGLAKRLWGAYVSGSLLEQLKELAQTIGISVAAGDIQLLDGRWYVTHSGLLRLARRKRCVGIQTAAISEFCDRTNGQYAFKATVFTSRTCKGFVGYGDADPSNVSSLSAAPRCAWPRRALSIALCAKPTGSASARLRKSVPSPDRRNPPENRRSFHLNLQTETGTVAPRSAIACARLSASISSIPIWSKRMQRISVV